MVAVNSRSGRQGGPNRPVDAGSPVPYDVLEDPVATAAAYRAHIERTGLSPATIRAYTTHTAAFARWLAEQPGHRPGETFTDEFSRDFATRDYRAYLSLERRLKPASVDAALAALDSMFMWVGLGRSTTKRVSSSSDAAGYGEHLTEAQSKAVLRAAERRGPRDLALVCIMRFAGLRVAEVANLNTDDWWAQARSGVVTVHGKGSRSRTVPLAARAREVLLAWEKERRSWPGADGPALFLSSTGSRIAIRSIRHVVEKVGEAAEVEGLHPHQLRHTFARRLVSSGVPLPEVQMYLGHSSVATTTIYTRPSAEDLSAAIERGEEEW